MHASLCTSIISVNGAALTRFFSQLNASSAGGGAAHGKRSNICAGEEVPRRPDRHSPSLVGFKKALRVRDWQRSQRREGLPDLCRFVQDDATSVMR